MPSHADSPPGNPGRRLLVTAGTSRFEHLEDRDLPAVPQELERIQSLFSALGYQVASSCLDPDRDTLRKLFVQVKRDCAEGDVAVGYYTSHGAGDADRFYLLTRESNAADLDETALAAEELARALCKNSRAKQILLILDTCHAETGQAEVTALVSHLKKAELGNGPGIFILAAARTRQHADQGALSLALAEALANPVKRLGAHTQRFLATDEVMDTVDQYLGTKYPTQVATLSSVSVREGCCLFPNPHYRVDMQPGLDLETQHAFTRHWVPKAGGTGLGAGGWYFTGREQALGELAAWLRQPSSGNRAWVVTGGPGSGKSAVLARIVTLSHPTYRKDVLAMSGAMPCDPATLPPEGVVDVAVHARHMVLNDVVKNIADGLHLVARTAAELVDALARRPDKTVIVIDALDESDDRARIVAQLLRPLAEFPQMFLLVGTRPNTIERGRRFRALGESAVEIDLDAPRYIGPADVARYAERRLLAAEEPRRPTPYRAFPHVARAVAQALAARAQNVFLVAHTAVMALLASPMVDINQPGWMSGLPAGFDEAFALFLDKLEKSIGMSPQLTRAVLLPLAFAEGEGLPWSDFWAAVGTAIEGFPIKDGDIERVREHAAPFIVEASEHDRSVYRLYHEKIAEQLRRQVEAPQQVQQRIVAALHALVPMSPADHQPDWWRARPYILTHLASHAVKAAVLGELATDGMFMAAADPVRMLPALSRSPDPFGQRAHAAYALAFHQLRNRHAEERLSYLELAARRIGDNALADVWAQRPCPRRWTVPWVYSLPLSPHRVVPTFCPCHSIALGTLSGQSVIVSGGYDGTVRVWDLASGAPIGKPLHGHDGWLESVALGTIEGRSVIVSGGSDGTVRRWDLASGNPIGEPLRGHEDQVLSVAVGALDGRPVIVSGSYDGTVRRWDLASCAQIGEPLRGHEGGVRSVALGSLAGRPIIVSGAYDGTVRRWDLVSGTPIGEPLRGHAEGVTSVALGSLKGKPVIVSGSYDGTVRRWDLTSGASISEPLDGQNGRVFSVAVGALAGRPVIVSGGNGGTVRRWDLASGAPIGEPLRGHEDRVTSVAVGTLAGRPVIVSGGVDRTVRVWDLAPGAPMGERLRSHHSWVTSVAVGALDGKPIIVSGGNDGTVQRWDLATGAPIGEPSHKDNCTVCSVAVGTFKGKPVIVSGSGGPKVRRWDLASGAPIGEPLYIVNCLISGRVDSVAVGTLKGKPVIVSSSGDNTVQRWDLVSGTPIGEPLRGHESWVTSVALGSLKGKPVIVSGSWDDTVRVWDLATGAPIGEPLRGHDGWVTSVAVGTLKGKPVIVSGGDDGTVRRWGLATGTPIGEPLRGHDGGVRSVALGMFDGRPVIVAGGDDRTVRVWDAQGREYAVVHLASGVTSVACAAGGTVVAGTDTGLVALQFGREGMPAGS